MNKYICVSEELRTIIYFEKIDRKRNQKQLHVHWKNSVKIYATFS